MPTSHSSTESSPIPHIKSRGRFLLVRSLGLCGLLWLYSLQAADQFVPPVAHAGTPATPGSSPHSHHHPPPAR